MRRVDVEWAIGEIEGEIVTAQLDELTGVLNRERWRPSSSDIDAGNHFVIADLEDKTSIKGNAAPGELIPGLTYRFFGNWDDPHPKYGRTFCFRQFTKAEPHSRFGLVKYLARYAPGVGPRIAGMLYDAFGSDACKTLRTDPERASGAVKGLTPEKAREASKVLQELSLLEDTKIELTNLFAGRGFPSILVDQVIARWGVFSPKRIQKDPFSLLVYGFAGCGFARCDRLYMDLGLPPTKLKRQMICAWHTIREDRQGHTWLPIGQIDQLVKSSVERDRREPQEVLASGDSLPPSGEVAGDTEG